MTTWPAFISGALQTPWLAAQPAAAWAPGMLQSAWLAAQPQTMSSQLSGGRFG